MAETQETPGYGTPVAWHTADTIRQRWEEAEDITDETLAELLTVARQQVEAFAPAVPEDLYQRGQCPVNYRIAQQMQARNLWNALLVDTDGGYGEESYGITVYPLDWQVKQLLRPKRAIPVAL